MQLQSYTLNVSVFVCAMCHVQSNQSCWSFCLLCQLIRIAFAMVIVSDLHLVEIGKVGSIYRFVRSSRSHSPPPALSISLSAETRSFIQFGRLLRTARNPLLKKQLSFSWPFFFSFVVVCVSPPGHSVHLFIFVVSRLFGHIFCCFFSCFSVSLCLLLDNIKLKEYIEIYKNDINNRNAGATYSAQARTKINKQRKI